MWRLRLFSTQKGCIRIGPEDAQPNDVVFIISGCNFPIVLVPRDGKFAVVGEIYSECLDYCTLNVSRLTQRNAAHGYTDGKILART
jgi:hypothetical protein